MLSLLTIFISYNSLNAQKVKSYARGETVAETSMSTVSQFPTTNMSMTVTWNSDGTLHLMDGTNWAPDGSLMDGTLRYKYTGNSGLPAMPNTRYTTLLMAPDFSVMVVKFVFGMADMYSAMSTRYTYIGDGAQPAYDFSNGNSFGGFDGGFGGSFGGSFGGGFGGGFDGGGYYGGFGF